MRGRGGFQSATVNYRYYIIRRAAVLPGGHRQYAGSYIYSSGSRGPHGGLERRKLKGGASRRI